MKILERSRQVLSVQRGTKTGFLLGTSFVMLLVLLFLSLLLYAISQSAGIGWGVLSLPLVIWGFWLALRRFLTNGRIVTIYRLDKNLNLVTIEFQGLRQSTMMQIPLHKIRSAEVKFLEAQYVGHGVTLLDFRLQFITTTGEILVDKAATIGEKNELEHLARCLRGFILNYDPV